MEKLETYTFSVREIYEMLAKKVGVDFMNCQIQVVHDPVNDNSVGIYLRVRKSINNE